MLEEPLSQDLVKVSFVLFATAGIGLIAGLIGGLVAVALAKIFRRKQK